MKLDQVGSFLRPKILKEARENFALGKIDEEQLRSIEDSCIRDLVEECDKAGIYYLSDGELRRSQLHLDFYWGFGGIKKIKKALSCTGAQAVYIPGNQFHQNPPCSRMMDKSGES